MPKKIVHCSFFGKITKFTRSLTYVKAEKTKCSVKIFLIQRTY